MAREAREERPHVQGHDLDRDAGQRHGTGGRAQRHRHRARAGRARHDGRDADGARCPGTIGPRRLSRAATGARRVVPAGGARPPALRRAAAPGPGGGHGGRCSGQPDAERRAGAARGRTERVAGGVATGARRDSRLAAHARADRARAGEREPEFRPDHRPRADRRVGLSRPRPSPPAPSRDRDRPLPADRRVPEALPAAVPGGRVRGRWAAAPPRRRRPGRTDTMDGPSYGRPSQPRSRPAAIHFSGWTRT
jgi:hypothetical protein